MYEIKVLPTFTPAQAQRLAEVERMRREADKDLQKQQSAVRAALQAKNRAAQLLDKLRDEYLQLSEAKYGPL